MLDFQLCRCASPALDLLFFLFTSTEQTTRRAHLEELLAVYLQEVRVTLAARGVTNPGSFYRGVGELRRELSRHAVWAFFLATCYVLPLVLGYPEDVPDLDTLTEDDFLKRDNPFLGMTASPLYLRRLQENLEDLEDMGFFRDVAAKVHEGAT